MARPSNDQLTKELYRLRLQVTRLSTDPSYNVTVRPAIENELPRIQNQAKHVVFIDLDHLHEVNDRCGYERVDGMIKRAVHVRCDDVLLRARWFSGDELVFILSGDPDGFCARLHTALRNEGLSATMAHTPFTGNLNKDVTRCADLVQAAKRADLRGITVLPDMPTVWSR